MHTRRKTDRRQTKRGIERGGIKKEVKRERVGEIQRRKTDRKGRKRERDMRQMRNGQNYKKDL